MLEIREPAVTLDGSAGEAQALFHYELRQLRATADTPADCYASWGDLRPEHPESRPVV